MVQVLMVKLFFFFPLNYMCRCLYFNGNVKGRKSKFEFTKFLVTIFAKPLKTGTTPETVNCVWATSLTEFEVRMQKCL